MLKWFRKTPEPIDPLQRVKNAVDELNNALILLPRGEDSIRPFTEYDKSRRRHTVMLGYWDVCQRGFVSTYGDYREK